MEIYKELGYCGPEQVSKDWLCVKLLQQLTDEEEIYVESEDEAHSFAWRVHVLNNMVAVTLNIRHNFILSNFGISEIINIDEFRASSLVEKFNKLYFFWEQFLAPMQKLCNNHLGNIETYELWLNANPADSHPTFASLRVETKCGDVMIFKGTPADVLAKLRQVA